MNVQALAAAGLLYRDLGVLWPPASGRADGMRRMHSITEQHRLIIIGHVVQQILIGLDESGLFLGIELARNRCWLALNLDPAVG